MTRRSCILPAANSAWKQVARFVSCSTANCFSVLKYINMDSNIQNNKERPPVVIESVESNYNKRKFRCQQQPNGCTRASRRRSQELTTVEVGTGSVGRIKRRFTPWTGRRKGSRDPVSLPDSLCPGALPSARATTAPTTCNRRPVGTCMRQPTPMRSVFGLDRQGDSFPGKFGFDLIGFFNFYFMLKGLEGTIFLLCLSPRLSQESRHFYKALNPNGT